MMLCIDVGNSQLYGGVFNGDELVIQFRRNTNSRGSSDELGLFLRSVLRENDVDPHDIDEIAICSVVPDYVYSLRACCEKYFRIEPLVLRPGTRTGLRVRYKDPKEVGADRIADAVGALHLFPGRNLIVVDFGTATTLAAVSRDRDFLGGAILPGVRLAMEALEEKTAALPNVEIVPVEHALGRTTVESIQAGLYFSTIGMIRELTRRLSDEAFPEEAPLVIATGGFSQLFARAGLFDHLVRELILTGLREIAKLNRVASSPMEMK
jgi:type III pantothenate kinase